MSVASDNRLNIDVIIPTYNRAPYIERAIESVLGQEYKNFLLYIVDDGSTDNTSLILQKYQNHPQIIFLYQKNSGVSSARNLAIQHSNSDWISFLDSDDEWMPEKLSKQMEYIKQFPNCNFLHTEEHWIRNGVRVNPKIKHSKGNEEIFKRSLERCLISPSTVLMTRKLLLKYGGFNTEFEICEDYDLWIKILANDKIDFLNLPLTKKYGGHQDQLSTKYVAMDYWRIKSLFMLYRQDDLLDSKKKLVKESLINKAEILMKGYLKHQNLEKIEEIKEILKRL